MITPCRQLPRRYVAGDFPLPSPRPRCYNRLVFQDKPSITARHPPSNQERRSAKTNITDLLCCDVPHRFRASDTSQTHRYTRTLRLIPNTERLLSESDGAGNHKQSMPTRTSGAALRTLSGRGVSLSRPEGLRRGPPLIGYVSIRYGGGHTAEPTGGSRWLSTVHHRLKSSAAE